MINKNLNHISKQFYAPNRVKIPGRSSKVSKHSSSRLQIKQTIVASLPIIVCFLVPLIQVGGVIYLYDIFIILSLVILRFPHVRNPYLRNFELAWRLLVVAVLLGCISALMRSGLQLKLIQYSVQYLLGLFYVRSLLLNIVAERVNFKKLTHYVATSAVILGLIAIIQFVMFQITPTLAENIYKAYLGLSDWSTKYFEGKFLLAARHTGSFRVVGTWDVATTFGGMLVLGLAWILYTDWSNTKKICTYSVMVLAILMTNSRHAWAIAVIIILFQLRHFSIKRPVLIIMLLFLIFGSVKMISLNREDMESEYSDLTTQISERVARTRDQGFADNSIQQRYIIGTKRFIKYSIKDPLILLVGFGTQTEKGFEGKYGRMQAQSLILANDSFGFVSNGWLLILRNWGIFGLLGLILMHKGPWRNGSSLIRVSLMVTALIIFSDNYSVHVTRCFFLITTFISLIWAVSLMPYNKV